jgi:hypothetical protein
MGCPSDASLNNLLIGYFNYDAKCCVSSHAAAWLLRQPQGAEHSSAPFSMMSKAHRQLLTQTLVWKDRDASLDFTLVP